MKVKKNGEIVMTVDELYGVSLSVYIAGFVKGVKASSKEKKKK